MPATRSSALAAVLVLLAGCAAPDRIAAPNAAPAPRAPQAVIAPPPAGVATGVAIESAPLGRPGLTAWDNWVKLVGRRPLYVMWFADWSSGFQGYAVTNAYGRGATPVVTWEMKNRNAAISYADVLSGKWNKYIDTWAAAARADGRALFVRFGHEMNGDWYGWSGARNGGEAANAPAQFVAVWKYVRGRFAKAGAANVTWVWCVNHESVPNAPWNTPDKYYPGDDQVDWTCADGYNWGTSQTLANGGWVSSWRTFDEVFGPVYATVTGKAPTKPFMIGEFASSELGGSKADWIADAAAQMATAKYDRIRAFVWFNYNKETDWRVESTTASLNAFKASFGAGPHFVWQP